VQHIQDSTTPDNASTAEGKHHQDGPDKVGVGCLITRIRHTPPGDLGIHARLDEQPVAS
jgi:hypothetical protein